MQAARSLLFNTLFWAWTLTLGLSALPLIVLPAGAAHAVARLWTGGVMALARVVVGLRYEVRGREHIPDGPVVFAAKHQSAFETLVFHRIVAAPVFVLKKELLRIPIVGWFMARAGCIAIDRARGTAALRKMLADTERRLAEGHPVVIFPEGTRTPPGTTSKLHPGVAMLDEHLDAPIVPVALNSGLFWRRRAFNKRPGTVVIEFLPALPKGLGKKAFLAELHTRLNAATDALIDEAGGVPETD